MLDAGAAVGSIIPGRQRRRHGRIAGDRVLPPDLDHYFITADPAEIAYIDAVLAGIVQAHRPVFLRLPRSRRCAPPDAQSVCRFYANASVLINSHFLLGEPTSAISCSHTGPGSGTWRRRARSISRCRTPTATVRRTRCRSTASSTTGATPTTATRSTSRCAARCKTAAWVAEGTGTDSVAFCSPI